MQCDHVLRLAWESGEVNINRRVVAQKIFHKNIDKNH
jgi:hypothetical protein